MSRTTEGMTCARCAAPIVRVPKRGPMAKFCTSKCANDGKHAKQSAERARNRIGLTCKGCGVKFDADRWKRKWCSSSCRFQHRRR